jgi:hypothetical protein
MSNGILREGNPGDRGGRAGNLLGLCQERLASHPERPNER